MLNLFFFNHKTAYDMRISDWSSDVCSSDLIGFNPRRGLKPMCGRITQRSPPDQLSLLSVSLVEAVWGNDRRERYNGAPGQKHWVLRQHPRSEERRVGKECVRPSRSRWSTYHQPTKKQKHQYTQTTRL